VAKVTDEGVKKLQQALPNCKIATLVRRHDVLVNVQHRVAEIRRGLDAHRRMGHGEIERAGCGKRL
jgi:hypothetical protein